MRLLRKILPFDRGASLILVAGSLMMLIGAAAIAVDLSALRTHRSADQKVTDSAASAGALAVVSGNGQDGCEAALAYVAINAEGIGSIDTSGCASTFPTTCSPNTPISHTVSTERYEITVTYPVPDSHDLMTSGLLGRTPQPVVAEDGEPCERVGVTMRAARDSSFAQVLGFAQGTTQVHTVAKSGLPIGGGFPINLLVLDRTGCKSIFVRGNGGIIVHPVLNEAGTGLLQGIIAADSDGSGCGGSEGVIHIDGTSSLLRADGPAGCTNQTGTEMVDGFLSGHGCGLIMTFALGPPECNWPSCVPGAGGDNQPNPKPKRLPDRLTRAPVDYTYNCWSNYGAPPPSVEWASVPLTSGNGQDIDPCQNADGSNHHIYKLIDFVGNSGTPSEFVRWNADLGHSCNIGSGAPDITETANIIIDCSTFTVRRHVRINGDVIFDGDVNVTSGTGHLDVRTSATSEGWAFFRGGTLTKDAQASLTFDKVAVYMSRSSKVSLSGGNTGNLRWIAPDSGKFDALALWSDSPLQHDWAGQSNLQMEGVFFMPRAHAVYTGSSGMNQTNAQWLANSLEAAGQGRLVIKPAFGRGVELPILPATILLR